MAVMTQAALEKYGELDRDEQFCVLQWLQCT